MNAGYRHAEARRFLNDRLDWNLLRTFLVIGQEGSISRAAARLHLSQPAVSQALKRLEEQLESALVIRSGPRIALSKAGEEVMQIAAELYGTVSRLGPALDAPEETVAGKIRILMISRIESRSTTTSWPTSTSTTRGSNSSSMCCAAPTWSARCCRRPHPSA